MRLELLDELIALGHSGKRSLDCVIAVKLSSMPTMVDLISMAQKAQAIFPKTASFPVKIFSCTMEEFINTPLTSHLHLELALLDDGTIALKMSHLLGDAVSMLLWMKALIDEIESSGTLFLKSFPTKKDTPYRGFLNSQVWPGPVKKMGARRETRSFTIKQEKGFKTHLLNDLFVLALLDSLPQKRRSIWLPINVRKKFFEGFGNGLSRMRIYPPQGDDGISRLQQIREQKSSALTNGEVSLPPDGLHLSSPLKKGIFKLWLTRPWADWGSISFSHIIDKTREFRSFNSIRGVSNIMPKHQAALFAFSRQDETEFTFTFDPLGVGETQAEDLINSFKLHTQELFHACLAE